MVMHEKMLQLMSITDINYKVTIVGCLVNLLAKITTTILMPSVQTQTSIQNWNRMVPVLGEINSCAVYM